MRLLLARCIELGARIAEPGEFTRRAFLNGKLDLAQAESVADLIDAATATAARAAARSLAGEFSREIHALVDALTELRMYTEATLDFPEEDVEFLREGDVVAQARARCATSLARVRRRARTGALLREGLTVVLVGRPNVGKSSLLNLPRARGSRDRDARSRHHARSGRAARRDRRHPADGGRHGGLARDRRRGRAHRHRAHVGGDRARRPRAACWSTRATPAALRRDDRAILARLPADLPRVVVHNKTDLAGIAPQPSRTRRRAHVWLCARDGAGVELLERAVLDAVGASEGTEDTFLARARHVAALRDAAAHLAAAAEHVAAAPPPIELFAEELRGAQDALAAITGEFTADDLLGAIFGRFCIGK